MLRVIGQFTSGDAAVDLGVVGLSSSNKGGILSVYAYSGVNGGVARYMMLASGNLFAAQDVNLSAGLSLNADTSLYLTKVNNADVLLTGANTSNGLLGWSLTGDGSIGNALSLTLPTGFASKVLLAQSQTNTATLIFDPVSGRVAAIASSGTQEVTGVNLTGATAAYQMDMAGQSYLIAAMHDDNGVEKIGLYGYNETSKILTEKSILDQETGYAVSHVSQLELIETGGKVFAVVAGAGSSSLTVIELKADGTMHLRDHVLDSRDIRIDGIAAMDFITVNDRSYIVAGGGDDGVTLFEMMPDGQLIALATLEDGLNSGLTNISAVKIIHQNNKLMVVVGGETESGVTVLEWALSTAGSVIEDASSGSVFGTSNDDILRGLRDGQSLIAGAGDDILIASGNNQRLTGGAGEDLFLMRAEAQVTTITDFERGIDRIDPSGWPGVFDLSQITVTARAGGVKLGFFGRELHVLSADGGALTLADITNGVRPLNRIDPTVLLASPEGGSPSEVGLWEYKPGPGAAPVADRQYDEIVDEFDWSEVSEGRVSVLPTAPDLELRNTLWPNDPSRYEASTEARDLMGTAANDRMIGASGGDRLDGRAGNDTLYGGAGNDSLFGDLGDDLILALSGDNLAWGGAGNDTLRTGNGADDLAGGEGDDFIDGGDGNNTLWGGMGKDKVFSGSGNDHLGGGEGNDLIQAGSGNDTLYGGAGFDVLFGEDGNDVIWGGAGNDLIVGGNGNDSLAGGSGVDHLWGGNGADHFVFYNNYGVNYLRDFNGAEGDRIALARWIFGAASPTTQEIVDKYTVETEYGVALLLKGGATGIVFYGVDDIAEVQEYVTLF